MKKIILSLIILGVFSSCQKEEILSKVGMYVETYPVKGRTKINFIDNERLIKMLGEDFWLCEEFKYEIRGNKIIIQDTIYHSYSTLYFRMINKNKFKIGNLYGGPLVPGAPDVKMIFEKE